uniref:Peptidase S8/S53 domain-containing protein n=1 Tax=Salix viminalis TaxID=40686 RepID=A0A6N2LP26_SALVM
MSSISPDAGGHGHTIIYCNWWSSESASFMGLSLRIGRGGAPSAWLAATKFAGYRWLRRGRSSRCIDDAIFDGVDVLSVSLGSTTSSLPPIVEDAVAIGSFMP